MKIGVAYHPELWPRDQWEADARSMVQFGIDVVKVGEFSWASLEPRRERMETDWLVEAVDILAVQGLKVIMCTPTAGPPPWLFNRHKSILPERSDGRRWYYGSKSHICINHPAYLKYVRRIVTELARIFGDNQAVYAWQIDSELSAVESGICYCDECEQAFRRWLKRRYGTIDRLNKIWGTAFWSQKFVDWHEVPVPRDTPFRAHPSLLLDYKRFVSARTRAFAKKQKDIIGEYAGHDANFIFTLNEPSPLPALENVNSFSMSEIQDVVSVVNYPGADTEAADTSLGLDLTRSLKKKHFWVLRQEVAADDAYGVLQQPKPGQLSLWAYQAAAKGAELICFSGWRTPTAGQSMYSYGLLDPDGVPRWRYDELQNTCRNLLNFENEWNRELPPADVAVYLDFESGWALKTSGLNAAPDYFEHVASLYKALRKNGLNVDFVSNESPFENYPLLIVPMPFIANHKAMSCIDLYARRGGTLLVTAPAAYVSSNNTNNVQRPPGALTSLLGVEVKEYDSQAKKGNRVEFSDGVCTSAEHFYSIIETKGADVIAEYKGGCYEGAAAMTASKAEQGKAMYLAAELDAEGVEKAMQIALQYAGVEFPPFNFPTEVEIIRMNSNDDASSLFFVLNHSEEAVELTIDDRLEARDLFTDDKRDIKGALNLTPFQTSLIEIRFSGAADKT